jgi:mannonate dehydratase
MGKERSRNDSRLWRAREHLRCSFRNVSSTLPRFHETFPDEGYLNLYQAMKALRQVRYSGPMVPDHIPPLVGDTGVGRGGLGYCIGFMRALLRANEEVG